MKAEIDLVVDDKGTLKLSETGLQQLAEKAATALQSVKEFREEQERAAVIGQTFEAMLKSQGSSIEEWAQAQQHSAQATQESVGVTGMLADALENFGSVGHEAASVLTGIGDAAGAAGIVVGALVGSVVAVGDFGNKLANLRAVTGLSTETLAVWSEQAAVTGVSAETMAMAMERLGARAEEGNKKVAEGLQALGMSTEQFLAMSPESRFQAITEALTGIEDPAQRAAVAMELFGRGGLQMLPAMTDEAARFREQLAAVGMDTEAAAEKGKEWKESVTLIEAAFGAVYKTIGLAFLQFATMGVKSEEWVSGFEARHPWIVAAVRGGFSLVGIEEGMPSFAGTKGGSSTTGDVYFPQTEKGDEEQRKAIDFNMDYETKAREKAAREAQRIADQEAREEARIEAEKARAMAQVMDASQRDMEKYYASEEKRADATAKYLIDTKLKQMDAEHKMEEDNQKYAEKVEQAATQAIQRHKEEEIKTWQTVQAGIGAAIQFLEQFGVTADSTAGKLLGLAQAGAGLGEAIASGNPMGIISAGFSALGSVFGLFHNDVIEKLNDQRDAWFAQQGGVDALEKSLNAMGQTGDEVNVIIKQLYDAKTPEQFKAAVDAVNAAMGEGKAANQALDDAMKKYGISISQLGPTFRQQKMDEQAKSLIQDYEILKGAGVDQSVIIQKMGSDFNKYVQESMKAGTAIPENLRPVIEAMEKAGTLTDAAGHKITDVSKIKFTQSLTEGLSSAVDAINKLVAALQNMYGYSNAQAARGGINIPVTYSGGAPPGLPGTSGMPAPSGPNYVQAQSGFEGVVGNIGGGLGPLFQTHAGEYVSIKPPGESRSAGSFSVQIGSVLVQGGTGMGPEDFKRALEEGLIASLRSGGVLVTRVRQALEKR